MAFCELRYFSPSLGKQTAANVLLPEGKNGPFPVYYLLHGLSDDHTAWHRRSSIERYVLDLPLIVVMPDGGRSFYCDALEGPAYESSIIKDLIPYIDSIFPTRAERSGRSIGGLSMGGYGATKLAMQYSDLFISANSHSGALAYSHWPITEENAFTREQRRIVGDNPVGGPNDCFSLATQRVLDSNRPALLLDCGTEDFLLDANRDFHTHLQTIGYDHTYREFAGEHNWNYWDEHIREALQFHATYLNL
jgi:putative tributyrin esterase